jgi:hypothetical protein
MPHTTASSPMISDGRTTTATGCTARIPLSAAAFASVGVDGVRQARFAVADPGPTEHGITKNVDEADTLSCRSHCEPDGGLRRRHGPVGPAARCVDDQTRAHLAHDGVQAAGVPQTEGVPDGLGGVAGPGGVRRCRGLLGGLPNQLGAQETAATDDEVCCGKGSPCSMSRRFFVCGAMIAVG